MSNEKSGGLAEFLAENAEGILVSVLAGAVLSAIVAVVLYFSLLMGQLNIEPATLGQTGDYFGGVLNPVFGFLSVFALLVALVLQTRELKLSRESLKLSRDELELSRAEQARSTQALASQNKAIQKQSFEQTFFAWLGTYRQMLGEITFGEETGRDALKFMWQPVLASEYIYGWNEYYYPSNEEGRISRVLINLSLKSLEDVGESCYSAISTAAGEEWDALYKSHEIKLDSFYRVLYRLFKWIDEQPRELLSEEDKWLYAGIVRSHLSWIEQVFLFYNGMTARGAKFKALIEKYALFDNLTIESDRLLVIIRDCPIDSTGYSVAAYNSDTAKLC